MIHEEALRGIDRQQATIDALRSRTGTLFSAASLVSAFLGAQALERQAKPDLFYWVAIGSFVVLFLLVLAILWPWGFRFVLSPTILIEDHIEKSVSDLQIYLAQIWRKNYEQNQGRVDQLHWVYRAALLALAIEVVAWLLSLAS